MVETESDIKPVIRYGRDQVFAEEKKASRHLTDEEINTVHKLMARKNNKEKLNVQEETTLAELDELSIREIENIVPNASFRVICGLEKPEEFDKHYRLVKTHFQGIIELSPGALYNLALYYEKLISHDDTKNVEEGFPKIYKERTLESQKKIGEIKGIKKSTVHLDILKRDFKKGININSKINKFIKSEENFIEELLPDHLITGALYNPKAAQEGLDVLTKNYETNKRRDINKRSIENHLNNIVELKRLRR